LPAILLSSILESNSQESPLKILLIHSIIYFYICSHFSNFLFVIGETPK
jgi:hypothetical protein